MAETVDVPGIGRMDRRWVYAIVAAGVGVVGYAWWSRSRASAEAVPVDPITGQPITTAGDPLEFENPNPQTHIDTRPEVITTNTEWVQAVTESLSNIGYEPSFIGTVLGKYLAGQPLTNEEAQLVRTAWAYEGKPPEGPANFTVSPTTPKEPEKPEEPKQPAQQKPSVGPSIRVTSVGKNSVSLAWWAVPNATTYYLYSVSPTSGEHKLNVGNKTAYTWGNLARGTTYSFYVAGANKAGEGPKSNVIRATTKK